MSASVAIPFCPSCQLNGAFLEAHPKAGAGGLLSRGAVQIQGLDCTWTGAHLVSEGYWGKSTREVFPGFSKSSDHQGMWAEKAVDLHLLALLFRLPEALSPQHANSSLLCIARNSNWCKLLSFTADICFLT